MSARSFRSVFMVASCAGAALSCYLVSLRVASERAALEDVETKIVLAQRDIRALQTEIGTRGRLAQLERWNVKVLALSAPAADQFLEGGFQLARLTRPEPKLDVQAPVVLASAPAPQPTSPSLAEGETTVESGAGANLPAASLMREASLKVQVRGAAEPNSMLQPPSRPVVVQSEPKETNLAPKVRKPADENPAAPALAKRTEAKKVDARLPGKGSKAGDKTAGVADRPVTKSVRLANVDPLAPLPAKANPNKAAKDTGSAR